MVWSERFVHKHHNTTNNNTAQGAATAGTFTAGDIAISAASYAAAELADDDSARHKVRRKDQNGWLNSENNNQCCSQGNSKKGSNFPVQAQGLIKNGALPTARCLPGPGELGAVRSVLNAILTPSIPACCMTRTRSLLLHCQKVNWLERQALRVLHKSLTEPANRSKMQMEAQSAPRLMYRGGFCRSCGLQRFLPHVLPRPPLLFQARLRRHHRRADQMKTNFTIIDISILISVFARHFA